MFKKLFLTIITICILYSPILVHAMNIELPYLSRDNHTKYISIELPSAITEDFSKLPCTRSALDDDKEFIITGPIDSTICKLTFTNKVSNTTYILYVYCKAPLVVGLQKIEQISPYYPSDSMPRINPPITFRSFWKYIDKKPVETTTAKEFYHFLALLNGNSLK